METLKVRQVVGDQLERWGQVTCIQWLTGTADGGSVLCFGTGRGLILIYQRKEKVSAMAIKEKQAAKFVPRITSENCRIQIFSLLMIP